MVPASGKQTENGGKKKKRGVGEKEVDISWAKSLLQDLSMAHYSLWLRQMGKHRREFLFPFVFPRDQTKTKHNFEL